MLLLVSRQPSLILSQECTLALVNKTPATWNCSMSHINYFLQEDENWGNHPSTSNSSHHNCCDLDMCMSSFEGAASNLVLLLGWVGWIGCRKHSLAPSHSGDNFSQPLDEGYLEARHLLSSHHLGNNATIPYQTPSGGKWRDWHFCLSPWHWVWSRSRAPV